MWNKVRFYSRRAAAFSISKSGSLLFFGGQTKPWSVTTACAALVVLGLGQIGLGALSNAYHLVPSPPDLYDLAHENYYTWGIDRPWSGTEPVMSASLSFTQIRNWAEEDNVLYIHLLDEGPLGVTWQADTQAEGDDFAGQGVTLTVYEDLPSTAQDLTYHLTADQITVLETYAADGRFALGLDPDCHYFNEGVAFDVAVTPEIPEPATVLLLVIGIPLAYLRRR